jgi:hypothetical protein
MTDEASDKKLTLKIVPRVTANEPEGGSYVEMPTIWNQVAGAAQRRLRDALVLNEGETLASGDGKMLNDELISRIAAEYTQLEKVMRESIEKIVDNHKRGLYYLKEEPEKKGFEPNTFVTMNARQCVNGLCRGVTVHESTETTCVIWQQSCLRHRGELSPGWLVKTASLRKWIETDDKIDLYRKHPLTEASKAMQIVPQWASRDEHDRGSYDSLPQWDGEGMSVFPKERQTGNDVLDLFNNID